MHRPLNSITVCVALACLAAGAAAEVDIREWRVPYAESRPRDPYAASATSVRFVGQRAGCLAQLNAGSGEFRKIDLEPGSDPHNLIVGRDGIVWYAGNRNALIGRYDPATGRIEEIPMPDPDARDPHTLVFDDAEKNISAASCTTAPGPWPQATTIRRPGSLPDLGHRREARGNRGQTGVRPRRIVVTI